MNKTMIKALAAVTALLLLGGCGAASSGSGSSTSTPSSAPTSSSAQQTEQQALRAGKLVVGTTMPIENASRADYYFDVLSGTLSQLAPVWMDDQGQYQPLLTDFATDDAKTWTLTVRPGMKWQDGIPVTAGDIAFTLEYQEREEPGKFMAKYDQVEVVDETTLRLVLKVANVNAPSDWTTLRVLPQHVFKDVPTLTEATQEQATLGCGPYAFERYDKTAGTLTFRANTDYPGMGQAAIDQVTFRLFGNADTQLLALRKGEIDMVYSYAGGIDPVTAELLTEEEALTLDTVQDASNPAVLVFNNSQAPWDNQELRLAVSLALDYDKFAELFGSPYATTPGAGFVPAGSPGYIETTPNRRDLDKANAALDTAAPKDAAGVRQYNGQPLKLTLTVRGDKPVYQRMGELVTHSLAEVGIPVELQLVDVPQFRTITEQEHSHQAMLSRFTAYGMGMEGGMGSGYLDSRLESNGQGQLADPDYHKIVDALRGAATAEDYNRAAADCQNYYAAQRPAIALYWDCYIQAYNSDLSGFQRDGTFGLLNVQTWPKLAWNAQ